MATASVLQTHRESDNESCPICYTREAITKTSCGHMFCNDCLNEWLTNHVTCPMCRSIHIENSQNEQCDYIFDIRENNSSNINLPVDVKGEIISMTEIEASRLRSITNHNINTEPTSHDDMVIGNVYANIGISNTFIIGRLNRIKESYYVLTNCVCMMRSGKVFHCTPSSRPILKNDNSLFYQFD
jgi:hypothetical protein